ncbi:hypothetical protein ACO2Q3_04805 [Caulobacter sp. KR2-114]|uniref:hypothetical protein n=1 Tax=Caulobacter sp. KR2-114 TaxID=3400912 RepID=UPI003C107DEF
MTGREAFALAIRIGGAWKVLESFSDIYFMVVKVLGLPTTSTLPLAVDVETFLYRFGLGLVLILLADPLARVFYRAKEKPVEESFS